MALKSDNLPKGRKTFAKFGKEQPYVNLESTNTENKKTEAKSSPPEKTDKTTTKRREYERMAPKPDKLATNNSGEYERLATAQMEKRREDSFHGPLPPFDGVRFRECKKQRVGVAVIDYEAQKQGELTLKHGSMMEIVAEECGQEGWALARVDDLGRGDGTRVGIVPRHYLALMGSQPEIVAKESVKRTDDALGAGSYAEVFRGTYKGKEVALKLARTDCGEALKREALILSRLCHENIVQFFAMSIDPVFIVLELCEGGTLHSLYRKMESSDVLTVIFWAKQVACALEHLHGMNEPLVYADMKAENVLIKQKPCECALAEGTWKALADGGRADGRCRGCGGMRIDRLTLKLADFNVSRPAGEKRDSCSGSMPWKSPDMMQGAISHPKMDVWSFGMFFWELLTRQTPDLEAVIRWACFIKVGRPLPLPDDVPDALRQIFDGCWQWKKDERPSIVEVKTQLNKAEQSVDSSYKWKLATETQQKEAPAEVVLEQMQQQQQQQKMFSISEQKVQLYLERVYKKSYKKPTKMERILAAWFQPPDPKRQKRTAKLEKRSIGTPSGFRHIVSAQVERADNSGDKPTVKLYANAELAPLQRQQSHRSHDSLLECGREGGGDRGGKSGAPAVGYATLPRTFRVQQPQQKSPLAHNLLPPALPPKSSCCRAHPCCAKKVGGLVKIKTAKSNPELNILGTKSGGGKVFPMGMGGAQNAGEQKIRHRSPQPISRPHDYLSLLPSSCPSRYQQQTNACQRLNRPPPPISVTTDSSVGPERDCPLRKDRAEPNWTETDEAICDDNDLIGIMRRQYVNLPHSTQKAARRTNAVRQRMVADATESSDCSSDVTTPNGAIVEELVSLTAAEGDGAAMARENGSEKSISSRTGVDSLSALLNRRVSPPHHHSLSPSGALSGGAASIQLRRATCGELDKSKRGELGHSIFYVDEPDSPSAEGPNASHSLAATPSSDEMGSSGGGGGSARRRSNAGSGGVHRSIASLIFKPLIGAKSSPRCSDHHESDIAAGVASGGITMAWCFHPHHGTGVVHFCALSSAFVPEFQLGPAPGQLSTRPIEFVNESPSSAAAGRVTAQRNSQHNTKFIKRADYPENQARQRHRTESAATAAMQSANRRTHLNPINNGPKYLTTEQGRQRRVSSSLMDTVIEMHKCAPPSNAFGGALSPARPAQSPRGSSSLLNATIPLHANNANVSPFLLSPENAAFPHWHQRSRSSDSPAEKPLSPNDLADLLRRHPVPVDGSITNPSYVPMQENQSIKFLVPTAKGTHLAASPAPQFAAQQQEERPKRPMAMPPTENAKKNGGGTEDISLRCPTSQAPVLNRAEMAAEGLPGAFNDFSVSVSEQCRPTTLRLGHPPLPPSVPSPDIASVSFGLPTTNGMANGQNGAGGWDSGMCASSSNEGDDCSPQTFAPPKNVASGGCSSATVFPTAAPRVGPLRSSNASHPLHISPPFPPPPVPPKTPKDKEGPRVPPLPRNRRMMKQ
ncbi:hypothetical protein niasHT_007599 [Heterodera trifolii]|uniref:mitogen-activated protein kinase kinase kinase n=1 Tax=Heterodera trifolii TaxID=157864 RepID=A0ABD2LPN2_9BILA